MRLAAGVAISLGIALLIAASRAPGEPNADASAEAEYVGRTLCAGCHKLEAEHWDPTRHGRLFERPRTPLEERGCEACHGPGSRHLADPFAKDGIVAFTHAAGASVERMNSMCLACHAGGSRIYWMGSAHER